MIDDNNARTDNDTDTAWEVIHTHTRADLIEDGDLVDVSERSREAGIRWPVALTRAAWADCVEWSDALNRRKGAIQDEMGRLWDVLSMARFRLAAAARTDGHANTMLYRVLRTPVQGRARKPVLTTLQITVSPGDNGEPVITIGLPGED